MAESLIWFTQVFIQEASMPAVNSTTAAYQTFISAYQAADCPRALMLDLITA